MNPTLIASLRTLITDPDRPDHNALFAILADTHATTILGCLAPPGSLAQIAAALKSGQSWNCDGWERHTDKLVGLITDPQCPSPNWMITTWSSIPSAVGVLRDRTDDLIAWGQQRLHPSWYDDLAMLLGPSDASARLLVRDPSQYTIGTTLRRWSMGIDPDNPTAWQAMINADMRAALHQRTYPSRAFPAWGGDDAVDSGIVLSETVNDIIDGWSPDHPSLQGQIGWLEHLVASNRHVGDLAFLASIGGSDTLADAVCASLGNDPSSIPKIAEVVPWSRLHSHIQTVIDTTMQQSSDDRWTRTWACAIRRVPVKRVSTIDANLLLWRIAPERWNDLDPSIRIGLVFRRPYFPPDHCYGWGMHPDLVERRSPPYEKVFRFWNPDVPPDDLRAWAYADRLLKQTSLQEARDLIALLHVLPSNRRARFEPIIDWRLGNRSEAPPQPPWDWADWAALPTADRQQRLRDRLAVLWGDCATLPKVHLWRARNDGLATLALMVGEMLGPDDPTPILTALLAQIPALRVHMLKLGPTLPFPNDLDAALRAQIERLPLARDAQAYAAWCLRFLDQDMVMGSTLIALHPDVAIALAPVLTTEQRAMVTASPAAQGWNSMTIMHWTAAYASAEEPTTPPTQRRL